MNTSPTSFLTEIKDHTAVIPKGKLAYFRERQRNRLYDFIVGKFMEKEEKKLLSRAQLARRIGKTPDIISRLLSNPGNWTLDTLSDLMLGIYGTGLDYHPASLSDSPRNYTQLDRLHDAKHFTPSGNLRPIPITTGRIEVARVQ